MYWDQTGLLQFMQTRREKVAVPATIHCDHLIQARVEGASDLRESLAENKEVYDFLRSAAAQIWPGLLGTGRRDHPPGRAGELCVPWRADHRHPTRTTPNAGGLGACAVGVGGATPSRSSPGCPGRCSTRGTSRSI